MGNRQIVLASLPGAQFRPATLDTLAATPPGRYSLL
jgi:hypothetical protein